MKKPKQYGVLDLFCGTGALSYGIEQYSKSFSTVAGIDFDKAAAGTAQLNHNDAKIICGRIEDIAPEEVLLGTSATEVDVIVGGPPCQGFSSLRPSRGSGLDDPRNSLYKEYVKYVRVLRPRVFLMENVVGILTASDGMLVKEMMTAFQSIGYSVDFRIMNAANFGVPQKRERFFLIGTRQNLGRKVVPVFPAPRFMYNGRVIGTRHKEKYLTLTASGIPAITVKDAISDLPPLRAGEAKDFYGTPARTEYQAARRSRASKTLTLHEAARHNAKMLNVIRHAGASIDALPEGLVSSGYSSCYSRLDLEEPSTTITVKFTSPASSKCIHPIDHRAITPREAARLQSFDDDFKFFGSKTEIASQIGNAVPPLFGRAFGSVLDEILSAQGVGEH
jgi:DNA (cytosine-5)-methyltransferase 1